MTLKYFTHHLLQILSGKASSHLRTCIYVSNIWGELVLSQGNLPTQLKISKEGIRTIQKPLKQGTLKTLGFRSCFNTFF